MKANPNIDELLCSYVDGELPPRQQTEIQRLAARDPEVGRRLRQLQNSKALISGLPRAEAPVELLERIKLAVERKTLLEEQPTSSVSSAGVIHLLARRLLAAAAMIALLGVLGFVVYQIVAPVPVSNVSGLVASNGPAVPPVVVDSGFSGQLEIRTAMVAQAEAVLKKAIDENGLSRFVESNSAADASSYRLVGSREAARRLVASLQSVWPNFDGVTLRVEDKGASSVTVEAVTAEQAVNIVAKETTAATLESARNYAAMNAMTRGTPGREVLAMVGNEAADVRDLVNIDDQVRLTQPRIDKTLTSPQGDVNTSLTIILLRTR